MYYTKFCPTINKLFIFCHKPKIKKISPNSVT